MQFVIVVDNRRKNSWFAINVFSQQLKVTSFHEIKFSHMYHIYQCSILTQVHKLMNNWNFYELCSLKSAPPC